MELNTSSSYLAVRDTQRRYYLNGHWTVDWPGRHPIAGSIFEYKRPYNRPESLISSGPTNETLVIEVRYIFISLQSKYLFSAFNSLGLFSLQTSIYLWKHVTLSLFSSYRYYYRAGTQVYAGNTLWRELMRRKNTIIHGPSYAPSAQQPALEVSVHPNDQKYLFQFGLCSKPNKNGITKSCFSPLFVQFEVNICETISKCIALKKKENRSASDLCSGPASKAQSDPSDL